MRIEPHTCRASALLLNCVLAQVEFSSCDFAFLYSCGADGGWNVTAFSSWDATRSHLIVQGCRQQSCQVHTWYMLGAGGLNL